MNFIILGTEIPDYTLPMIEKYNSLDESQIVSEDVKMYNAAKMLTSDTYVIDMEQTRLYYKQKVYGLKVCFDRCLLSFGKFDIPSGGLGVWIPFDKPVYVDSALPELSKLGLYITSENIYFKPYEPILGIRIGFGQHDLKTFDAAFSYLATALKF